MSSWKSWEDRCRKALETAEEIEWDGKMMLYSSDYELGNHGFFESPDDFLECLWGDLDENDEVSFPLFLFACVCTVDRFDVNKQMDLFLEELIDDGLDFERWVAKFTARQEIIDAVERWNKENEKVLTVWREDLTRKIRIDRPADWK